MTIIETDRLILCNWRDEDRAVMHRLNSDETVMKYFPFRRNRIESDMMMETVRNRIAAKGYGWTAVELKHTKEVIGFTGISDFTEDVPFAPAVEIGWRFLPEFWGNGYATEAARAWLDHGFTNYSMDEIVSFAVAENKGSTAIMKRLGMRSYPDKDFDFPNISDDFAHLRPHVFYSISAQEFRDQNKTE
jgi:RimJ/RimL family protein N-acetyltransferase